MALRRQRAAADPKLASELGEWLPLLPLLALIFFLGFVPNVLTSRMQQPVGEILSRYAPSATSASYEQPIETHSYRPQTIAMVVLTCSMRRVRLTSSAREQARGGAYDCGYFTIHVYPWRHGLAAHLARADPAGRGAADRCSPIWSLPPGRKGWLALVGLAGVVGALAVDGDALDGRDEWRRLLWHGHSTDHVALFANVVILFAVGVGLLFSPGYLERQGIVHEGEYYTLMLLAALGMMLMSAASNLMIIFVGLEMLSLALYILCGHRHRPPPLAGSGHEILPPQLVRLGVPALWHGAHLWRDWHDESHRDSRLPDEPPQLRLSAPALARCCWWRLA